MAELRPAETAFGQLEYPTPPEALSSDYKNTKVREFLDAAEEEALRTAFARAEVEADMDDEFDTTDDQPATTATARRRAR